MSTDQKRSEMGLYRKTGQTALDDLYYYQHARGQYFELSDDPNVRVRLVTYDTIDESWEPIGFYGDDRYSVWVTPTTLSRHFRRITAELLDDEVKDDRQ